MKLFLKFKLTLVAVFAVLEFRAQAQGAFQNLNFESANLPTIPSGQSGGYVSISTALPGWTGLAGTQQVTQVLQNNLSSGEVSIDILGPDTSSAPGGIIDGNYTAALQAGLGSGGALSATIEQTGLVPIGSQSLQMKMFGDLNSFAVNLGSMEVNMVELSSTSTYTLYGGSIASFAGQTEQLSISALPTAQNPFIGFMLDDIVFSPTPVPEPSIWALMACGAGLLGVKNKSLKL